MNNEDYVYDILTKCNNLQLQEFANPETIENLDRISFKLGSNCGYLISPLISAVSYCMGDSYVYLSDTQVTKFITYSSLVANPSTGKSPVLKEVSSALHTIEKINGVPEEKSCISNSGTVEAVIKVLNVSGGSVISIYDEASSFFGMFGRYTNNGVSYDRSLFL